MFEHPDRCMAIGPGAARQPGSHAGWEGRLPTDCGSCVPEDANTEESEASCSLGMHIYCTVPAAKGLDRGISNSGQGCRGGSTYPKAVASIVVLWQTRHVEDAADLGYELAFCKGSHQNQ